MSLERWRTERIADRAVAFLQRHEVVRDHDQDALNVVMGSDWALLDPRWNVQTAVTWSEWPRATRPGEPPSPYPPSMVRLLRRDPWIVHFTSKQKPWTDLCRSPFQDEWLAVVEHTPWRDARPTLASRPRRWLRRGRWHVRALRHRRAIAR